jgi:hypothetical protein
VIELAGRTLPSSRTNTRTQTAVQLCQKHTQTFLVPVYQQHKGLVNSYSYIQRRYARVLHVQLRLTFVIIYFVFHDSFFCCCLTVSTWYCTCGLSGPLRMPSEVLRYLTGNTGPAVNRETKGPLRSLLDCVISYLRRVIIIIIIIMLCIFAVKDSFAGTDVSSALNLAIPNTCQLSIYR